MTAASGRFEIRSLDGTQLAVLLDSWDEDEEMWLEMQVHLTTAHDFHAHGRGGRVTRSEIETLASTLREDLDEPIPTRFEAKLGQGQLRMFVELDGMLNAKVVGTLYDRIKYAEHQVEFTVVTEERMMLDTVAQLDVLLA